MFGIGYGPSQNEKTQYGELSNASGFATNLGEKDLTASSDFMNAILSGDATKQAQVLAPEISAAKTSAAQDRKTGAEFGTRSGGTTAANNAATDKVHSDITDLLGQLTGSSASALSSAGTNLLGMGMSGNETLFGEANTEHDQNLARINNLFGSIANTVGAASKFIHGAGGQIGQGIAGVLQS